MRECTNTELVRLSDFCIHLLVKENLRGRRLVEKVRAAARRIHRLPTLELDRFVRRAIRLAETELAIRRPADPIASELTAEFEGTGMESDTDIISDQSRERGTGSRAPHPRPRSQKRVGHRRRKRGSGKTQIEGSASRRT
jgi:hypothetical protein